MKEFFKLIGTAIVVSVALFAIVALLDTNTEIISDLRTLLERSVGSGSESTVYKISAHQLFKEYESNEIAADQKYKGKILEVDGIVKEIGKDLQGSLYLVLAGGRIFGVQCYFSDAHANALGHVKKGQRITVKGKCSGYLLFGPDLKGCKIT